MGRSNAKCCIKDTLLCTLRQLLAHSPEMERQLIKERVRAGLEAAHKKGRKGGRPKVITPEILEKIKSFKKSDEFSVTAICKMLQISRTTYYRVITLIDNDKAV